MHNIKLFKILNFAILISLLPLIPKSVGSTNSSPDLIVIGRWLAVPYEEQHDALLYIDYPAFDTLEFLEASAGTISQVFWSPNGQNVGVVYQKSSIDSVCIYTLIDEEMKCWELELWGSYPNFALLWGQDNQIHLLLETEDGLPQIGVINTVTEALSYSIVLPLAMNSSLISASWSSDGQFLAYQANNQDIEDIFISAHPLYLLDVNTGEVSLLTRSSGWSCYDWSFDNRKIVVGQGNTFIIFNTLGDIYAQIDPQIGGEQLEGFNCPVAWSHNDTWFAASNDYMHQNHERHFRIVIVSASDGYTEVLVDNDLYPTYSIEWSWDDLYLATTLSRGEGFTDLRIISIGGTKQLYHLPGVSLTSPAWRPLTSAGP